MTDLTDALLADGPDLTDEAAAERWAIDSDELAGWAFRKLAHAEQEQARIRAQAADRVAAIKTWEDDAVRALQHDVDFFRSRLIDYRRTLEAQRPNLAKTYKLPEGSLVRRAGRPSTKVTDRDAFVSWALDNCPEALDYKPLVSQTATWPRTDGADGVTVLVEPFTGQIVPGLEVVTPDDTYDVRPADLTPSEF